MNGFENIPPVRRRKGPYLSEVWYILAGVLLLVFVAWPIRNIGLVCWVYGTDAYFHKGIRVLPGKPTRFSNGELAPNFPDFVTGMAAFVLTFACIALVVMASWRLYERYTLRQDANDIRRQ
jgi:hypothetical protein